MHIIVPAGIMSTVSSLVECLSNEFSGAAMPEIRLHEEKPLPFQYKSTQGLLPELEKQYHDINIIDRTFGASTAAARLILDQYLPNVSRAIWLDVDTLVNTDLAPLSRLNMSHAVAAATSGRYDYQMTLEAPLKARAQQFNITPDNFFNSGVLVIDLEQWRAENLTQKVAKWGAELGWSTGDQTALNFALSGKFDQLDPRWNVNALMAFPCPPRCAKEGRILHFNGVHEGVGPNAHLLAPYSHQCTPINDHPLGSIQAGVGESSIS